MPTPTPTPTCNLAVTAGPSYGGGGKFVSFDITNNAPSGSVTLESISVTWDSAYGNLKKIKFGTSFVWTGNDAPPDASLGSLSGSLSPGETKTLQFQFASNGGGGSVTFTATFSGPCTVGN